MEEMKLALEVLASWILLIVTVGLMAYGFYLYLELWETDRKNMLTLIAVFVSGMATGIILALIQYQEET